ncbi:SprT-like domain-containing protein [uncultured Brachyspira sp.]|uniref:SprT-like domain-containing protein n=1 Tax=uncultured Brachyspira sp. TaxID=221953 RepID=UPI00258D4BF9|nr:SprT-like domain-containing protein [uncultured Brachyspira sp.]
MANGLVEYSIEAKPEIKSIFESVGVPTPAFNQLKKNNKQSMDAFKNAISKSKQSLGGYGASVELKDDYTDINLYLSEDGESGFGIKPNGDIVSVFSSSKEKGRSSYMLEMAISQGGRQLDCFDIYLTKIYETHGFKPVAKMKWDDEYIPEGWNKDNFKDYNNGEPDVVFMAYDPNNDIEKKKKEAEEKYGKKNEIPYIIDYDDGEEIQHIYKWRSPAEREAIYNNMLERYKQAKTTEELKKVFSNSDKPFLRQMDDLNSLSKEQAQSIRAEYSKRYLELIKEENPEEYKKNKKYLEKKYNIKSDASVYIDSLIDTIAYIDAKKKDNIPAGTEWKTLDNGEHILVNSKTGEVIKGAGGSLSKEKNKNKKDNDKKDNSNPKKSNCNIGDTYNIAINSMATIPAKKLFESDNYELYEENANKLKPQQRKAIENAINNISKQYNELFNIYGKSDNQPTKKLKIVLLDESRKKKLKSTAGFVIKEGADNEEDNSIFLNTSAIKKEKENNIQKIIAHETIHTIINDNLRNKKMYFRPSNLLEEALAESGTFIVDGDNYREPPEDLDIDKKTKWILYNKYYFTSNLMHYLYLKNNKNSDIFKDIVNNMQGKEDSKFANAIQKTANKIGIEGGFSEIIKYWIKDKYNFNDEEAGDFKRTLMIKLENPKW